MTDPADMSTGSTREGLGACVDFVELANVPLESSNQESAVPSHGEVTLRSDSDGATVFVATTAGRASSLSSRFPGGFLLVLMGGRLRVADQEVGAVSLVRAGPGTGVAIEALTPLQMVVFGAAASSEGESGLEIVDLAEASWSFVSGQDGLDSWRELPLGQGPGMAPDEIVARSLAIGDCQLPNHLHDWDEEVLVLGGERLGPLGVMRATAYAFRPRGTLHGPLSTGTPGALLLVRRIGPHGSRSGPVGTEAGEPWTAVRDAGAGTPAVARRPATVGDAGSETRELERVRRQLR